MYETKVVIKFNRKNELVYAINGVINNELEVNDEIKEKTNRLIEKSDTSNFLLKLNAVFYSELDNAIQTAFENAVNKEYKKSFKDKTESE